MTNRRDQLIAVAGFFEDAISKRRTAEPSHVLFGRRFLDVVSTLEDGRLLVDYERFHETEPEEEAEPVETA